MFCAVALKSMILAECPIALPSSLMLRRHDEVFRARRPRGGLRAAFVGLLLRVDGKFAGRRHCQCVNVALGRRGLSRRVECDAAIDVGFDVVPIDTDGIAQVGDRQVVASRLRVHRSAAEVGLRETALVGITAVYNFRAALEGLAGVRARAHSPGETGDRVCRRARGAIALEIEAQSGGWRRELRLRRLGRFGWRGDSVLREARGRNEYQPSECNKKPFGAAAHATPNTKATTKAAANVSDDGYSVTTNP